MTNTEEHLSQFNLDLDLAKDYVLNNLGNLQFLYDTAISLGITNDMFAEILSDTTPDITGQMVCDYFDAHGFSGASLGLALESSEEGFTVEFLSEKTFYDVWWDNDINKAVVVERIFNKNETFIDNGILNNTLADFQMPYYIVDGIVSVDEQGSDGNKLICENDEFLVTHYYENGEYDGMDLFFYDQIDALNYADTLTAPINIVCEDLFI